jgi:hypothetical protein
VSNKSDWRASAQWFYDGNGTAPEEFGGEPNFCGHSQIICLVFVLKIYMQQDASIEKSQEKIMTTATPQLELKLL